MTVKANRDDDMPAEIDFSKSIRGKFAKPGTTLKLPVYLDADFQTSPSARSEARRLAERLICEPLSKAPD